jgi:hypothetical protein
MKKNIVLAIALGTFSFAAVNAQDLATTEKAAIEVSANYDGRTEMSFEELPEAIKTAFQESDFASWEVQKVEKVTPDDNPEEVSYELTLSDGSQSGILAFDEEGNIIE